MAKAKKAQVKVSAMVPRETHAQLSALAEEGKTTIGRIVAAAIPRFLDSVSDETIASLERDRRRVEARA